MRLSEWTCSPVPWMSMAAVERVGAGSPEVESVSAPASPGVTVGMPAAGATSVPEAVVGRTSMTVISVDGVPSTTSGPRRTSRVPSVVPVMMSVRSLREAWSTLTLTRRRPVCSSPEESAPGEVVFVPSVPEKVAMESSAASPAWRVRPSPVMSVSVMREDGALSGAVSLTTGVAPTRPDTLIAWSSGVSAGSIVEATELAAPLLAGDLPFMVDRASGMMMIAATARLMRMRAARPLGRDRLSAAPSARCPPVVGGGSEAPAESVDSMGSMGRKGAEE